MGFLLGIDAGTSAIKAALFDGDGHEIAASSQPAAVLSPAPAQSEADMETIWAQVCATVRAVCAQAGISGAEIDGVGITANMVGLWPVDASGQPVRRAILWNDGRTQPLLDGLEVASPGFMSRVSGSVMQPGCTLPLLRWLREHEPEVLARTHMVLCCKDWLRFRLTGALATDPTEASVMPGDTRARGYSDAAFEELGVHDLRHLFPPVLASEAVAGAVTASAAALTGLREGTPVVTGAGDVPASALGAGAASPGTACIVLGTTCLSGIVLGAPSWTPADVGLLFCQPGGAWLRVMANIAGTTNLDWIIGQCFAAEQAAHGRAIYAHLEASLADIAPGCAGLTYLPYLSDVGIIAPVVAPHARAGFFGLSPVHTRYHLLRAVMEGVALAVRDCYAAMGVPVERAVLVGGGANSPLWCQMIADVLGAEIQVPQGSEFGAKGAALLAGVGIGRDSTPAAAAARTTHIARAYQPDAARRALYDAAYNRYAGLRNAVLSAV
jgi:sugar (pentulose or hexulose) kinase